MKKLFDVDDLTQKRRMNTKQNASEKERGLVII
jgi:hypothetical protein